MPADREGIEITTRQRMKWAKERRRIMRRIAVAFKRGYGVRAIAGHYLDALNKYLIGNPEHSADDRIEAVLRRQLVRGRAKWQ